MAAYFSVESIGDGRVTFHVLQLRLIKAVNGRIQNGEFTERGLAKLLGISQPQIHNVLKGARKLGLELADRLLWTFGLTVFDLFQHEEVAQQDKVRQAASPQPGGTDPQVDRFNVAGVPKKRPTQASPVLRTKAHVTS